MRIIAREKIMPANLMGRNCHASHLLPSADGSLFAVWFEGTKEGEADVCIWGARRSTDGHWSEKRRLTADDGLPHWNPVLFRKANGEVLLFSKKGTPIPRWYTMMQCSDDDCETFSPAKELIPGDVGGRGPVRNKILRMSNGVLAAPASDENGQWRAFIDLSDDDGETWRKSDWLQLFSDEEQYHRRGVIQPTLWESEPGHIHALLRSSEGCIYRADSANFGETWCAPYPIALPNNNSGIDLAPLPDGRLILAYNPAGENWGPRNHIALAVSADNGATWQHLMNLENEPGQHEFSYPCVIAEGSTLHISYTFDRVNIAYWQIEME